MAQLARGRKKKIGVGSTILARVVEFALCVVIKFVLKLRKLELFSERWVVFMFPSFS